MIEDPDSVLIARLKRRDESAFNELVQRYQDPVYRLVFRMLRDQGEAEELTQEVFIAVFKAIDNFRGDAKLRTWLYRVATNQSINRLAYLKRRARGAKYSFDETFPMENAGTSPERPTSGRIPRPDEMAEGREAESLIQRALAALPEEQRALIVLREIESLSYEEIRDITGLAAGTVKSRLHRARFALVEQVKAIQNTEDES